MDQNPNSAAPHRWTFIRSGGFAQPVVATGADLVALPQLDQKLWAALSCPTTGVALDGMVLARLDADRDGHIRVPEVLAAIGWALSCLADPASLAGGRDRLEFSELDPGSLEGRRILAAARRMQEARGEKDAQSISLAEARQAREAFDRRPLNGDGVVEAGASEQAGLTRFIAALLTAYGGVPGRSGEAGVDHATLERYRDESRRWLAWRQRAELDPLLRRFPDPEQSAAALRAVADKVDDWFLRCRLAAYDSRAVDSLNGRQEDYYSLGETNLATHGSFLDARPLALVTSDAVLRHDTGLNPAWADAMGELRKQVLTPLGHDNGELNETTWQTLRQSMAPVLAWVDERPVTPLAALGFAQLQEWSVSGMDERLADLIAADEALRAEAEAFDDTETLLGFCRDLMRFVNNFVSLIDFFDGKDATFRAGTLYLDGRACRLVIGVDSIADHARLAQGSGMFLAYCTCSRGGGSRNIVAAITAGDASQISIGRNGVFYDREGLDWDARVVQVVDHPVSLSQAFWQPWRRVGQLVSEQLEKIANTEGQNTEKSLVDAITAPQGSKTAPDAARMAGVFGTIGLALGALGTALASLVSGLLSLSWWQIPIAIAGGVLAVSGPSVLIFLLRLRRRSLAPLLDASGWAVNVAARVDAHLGRQLTSVARLPAGSRQQQARPPGHTRWPWWLALAAAILGALATQLALATTAGCANDVGAQGECDHPLACSRQCAKITDPQAPARHQARSAPIPS